MHTNSKIYELETCCSIKDFLYKLNNSKILTLASKRIYVGLIEGMKAKLVHVFSAIVIDVNMELYK